MAGRKQIKLSEREKELSLEYVRTSGLNKTVLADVLGMAKSTLYDILKRDKEFQTGIKLARAEFRSHLVKQARPEFLLERMFRKEFFLEGRIEKELREEIEALRQEVRALAQKDTKENLSLRADYNKLARRLAKGDGSYELESTN